MLLNYLDFEPEAAEPIVQAPATLAYTEDKGEFMARRAGKITASKITDMLAEGKGLTREKYKMQLAIERITGQPVRGGFESRATRHGNAAENEAIDLYSFQYDVDIEKVGFVTHPNLAFTGCSPDALVNSDGMAQVKCPDQHTHLTYWIDHQVPREYVLQQQWEMACTNRQWSDFVCYDPDQIPKLRLLVIRVVRDQAAIDKLEAAAAVFNKEIEQLVTLLRTL
jgi:predicted phage-related endonuclease